uniref:Amino acid transporter n=3 Tax=Schistocephalus solidus TaxID=70667 RepID=A0A0X3QD98_SCHSO
MAVDASGFASSHLSEDLRADEVPAKKGNKCLGCLKDNYFTLATLAGVCVGFAIAFGIRTTKPSAVALTWISMPGEIYLRLLQMTILPLIASNILLVIAALEPKKNGRISIIGVSYVVLINLLGAAIGTTCASIIKPGSRQLITPPPSSSGDSALTGTGLTVSDVFLDMFYNLFPDNIVGVTIYQFRTEVVNFTTLEKKTVSNKPGTNMIGVLFVSIAFGAAARASKEKGQPFLDFFESLADVVTKLMRAFLQLTPVGVCFMVASSVASRTDIQSDFVQLGLFIATVLTGLAIHFILIVLVLLAASGKNPFRLLKYSVQPYLISFATTSPAVAIGEIYDGLDRYGVSPLISRFTTPLCSAMKGDGPAIFITSSVLFVAQQAKYNLDLGQVLLVLFLTFASSLAVPNIPSASMVLVVTVLSSVGVPTEGAGLLFAIEWLLDRCRSGSGGLSIMYIAATTQAIYDRTKKDTREAELEDSAPESVKSDKENLPV